MPRTLGKLYNFDTFPGYRRYFISPIGGVWLEGMVRHYISKGGQERALARRRVRRGLSGRETGRSTGKAGRQMDTEKIFSSGMGYVSLWRGVPGR